MLAPYLPALSVSSVSVVEHYNVSYQVAQRKHLLIEEG